MPRAIIDGAWAEGRPELLNTLRNHGTKLLVETHGWRYRYGATSEVAKLTTTSWSPGGAVSLADKAGGQLLVEASVRAQSALGADAYLIPGWMPDDPSEDLRASYSGIFKTIGAFDDVEARPFVLFVGGHTNGLDRLIELSTRCRTSCPPCTCNCHR